MHREQGLFPSENVDGIEMDGRKQYLNPMWKKLMNLVDLGQPKSFLDHVCAWDAINVNPNRTKV